MPSLKKSVMFSEQTQEYINARTRDENDIAWSQALNNGFSELQWLSANALPELTASEWQHILNVYSGCVIEFHPPYRIASDMMDNTGEVDLDKLDPEYANVVRKMHALSQVEQFAVMDFVQKFWCNDWNSAKDFNEIRAKIVKL